MVPLSERRHRFYGDETPEVRAGYFLENFDEIFEPDATG
jgi:hypothetical protein